MPIDTSIYNLSQPVKIKTPVEAMTEALTLRGLMQQQQVRQAELQNAQLEQQMKQQEFERSQAVNQAYKDAFTTGDDGSVSLDQNKLTRALAAGGHGAAIPGIMEAFNKFQQSTAALTETNGKVAEQQANAAGRLGAMAKASGYDPNVFLAGAFHAVGTRSVDPRLANPMIQEIQQAYQQDPEAARKLVQQYSDRFIAGSKEQQELANSRTTAEARQTTATTGQKREERESAQQRFQNAISALSAAPPKNADEFRKRVGALTYDDASRILGAVPAEQYDPVRAVGILRKLAMTPDQQAQTEQRAVPDTPTKLALAATDPNANPEETGRYKDALDALAKYNKAGRAINPDLMANAIEAAAQSLAKGDLTRIRDIASLRSDQRILLHNRIKELNPNYDVAKIDRMVKMEDYYANGKGADQLQSFGTFLQHAGAAVDAMNTLGGINATVANKSINWLRSHASSPEYRRALAAIEPVKKEFESFLLNNRALYTEDRASSDKILNEDLPLRDFMSAINTMGHTVEARMTEHNQRYRKVMGHDLVDPYSPEAIEGAKKIGITLKNPLILTDPPKVDPKKGPVQVFRDENGRIIHTTDYGKHWYEGEPDNSTQRQTTSVDPQLKAYADKYFGGDLSKAQAYNNARSTK